MKKLLCTLFAISATVLFAAVEKSYTGDPGKDYPDNYTDSKYTYADGIFTINSNYVWTDFTRRIDYSAESRSKISTNDISEFGFYLLDASGNKTGDYLTLYSTSGANNSVVLEKDQKIGIYMDIAKTTEDKYVKDNKGQYIQERDNKGNVTYKLAKANTPPSTQRYSLVEGETTTTRYTTTSTGDAITAQAKIDPDSWKKVTDPSTKEQYYTSGEAEQYFCMFLEGMTPGTSAHYEYYFDGILSGETQAEIAEKLTDEKYAGASDNIIINGKEISFSDAVEQLENGDRDQDVSGRPLPGLLSTILLGGAAIGAAKRYGKKRKNAAK